MERIMLDPRVHSSGLFHCRKQVVGTGAKSVRRLMMRSHVLRKLRSNRIAQGVDAGGGIAY